MASALNKRQQARNERALQDLIKNVAGNDRCADCSARNPGWASWSMGIFLCMRCAALHRKLGTHISKVKSLSMDSWTNEQVESMKRVGNAKSNAAFNPRNVKASMPIDVDEMDGAMERYIRQKYEHKALSDNAQSTRQHTGSTSSEDRPPPLPPKPGKRFGFGLRAASSTFPSSSGSTRSADSTPPISPGLGGYSRDPSPPRVNKASRVFGSNVGTGGDTIEAKLATLREMGFMDDNRNLTVLKGLNGNIDRTVETLIRLGEGNPPTTKRMPAPPIKTNTNGISIDRNKPTPTISKSANPFELLDSEPPRGPVAAQSQTQSSTPQAQTPSSAGYNPFLQPENNQAQQNAQQPLEQAFQNMQLASVQQQALFPNSTGGYGVHNPQAQQHNPYLHSFTPPPMPQLPPQYNFMNQLPSTQQQLTSPGNPFLKQSQSQASPPGTNPFGTQGGIQSISTFSQQPSNPFGMANPDTISQLQTSFSPSNPTMQQTFSPQGQQLFSAQSQSPFSTQGQPSFSTQSQQAFSPQNQQAFSPQNQSQFSTQGQSSFSPQGQQSFSPQSQQAFSAQSQSQFSTQGQSSFSAQSQQAFSPQSQQAFSPQSQQGYVPQTLQSFIQQSQQQTTSPQQSMSPQYQPQQPFTSPQPFSPQQQGYFSPTQGQIFPPRSDNNSILALYNAPQHTLNRAAENTPGALGGSNIPTATSPFAPGNPTLKQRSVTLPITSSTPNSAFSPSAGNAANPFSAFSPTSVVSPGAGPAMGNAGNGNAASAISSRHISNESVDFTGLMNGRHSPDAFAGLSARYVRS